MQFALKYSVAKLRLVASVAPSAAAPASPIWLNPKSSICKHTEGLDNALAKHTTPASPKQL
jgi:hypothetical protein